MQFRNTDKESTRCDTVCIPLIFRYENSHTHTLYDTIVQWTSPNIS